MTQSINYPYCPTAGLKSPLRRSLKAIHPHAGHVRVDLTYIIGNLKLQRNCRYFWILKLIVRSQIKHYLRVIYGLAVNSPAGSLVHLYAFTEALSVNTSRDHINDHLHELFRK